MIPPITMLNAMAAPDFATALDRHVEWGLTLLDLKDRILGKALLDLNDEEAGRAAAMIRERGLEVYCLSSGLFHADIETGPETFMTGLMDRVDRLIALAVILRPRVVRLIAAISSRRGETDNAVADAARRHPWLIAAYREAIDRIAGAGLRATIENETGACLLAHPAEVQRLFELIDRPGKVMFTWDIQNLWQAGTWPSVAVFEDLRDLTGYVHFKGGRAESPGGPLAWRSRLEDASYDVAGIVRAVVASPGVEALCLNPPHGKAPAGYDDTGRVEHDLACLRRLCAEGQR